MWREDLSIIHYRQPGSLHKGPHVPSLTWMKRYSTDHHMHLLESRWQQRARRGLSLIKQPPHSPLSLCWQCPEKLQEMALSLEIHSGFKCYTAIGYLKMVFPKRKIEHIL